MEELDELVWGGGGGVCPKTVFDSVLFQLPFNGFANHNNDAFHLMTNRDQKLLTRVNQTNTSKSKEINAYNRTLHLVSHHLFV